MKNKQMVYKELVTIVVPVYNAELFLHENVEAIIAQTYKNLEIIYVCDGCTDRTVEILHKYALMDARISIKVETRNHGAAISRNIGMEMATGDWIIFLDADDLFDRRMIEELLNAALKEQADIVACYLEYFDDIPSENAQVYNGLRKRYCKQYPIIDTHRELGHIMQVIDYGPCTKLIHKSIYNKKEVFFQDIPNTNDVYYSISAVINSRRIVYVDKVLLHYRSNINRETLSTGRNLKKSYILEAFDLVYQIIKKQDSHACLLKSFYNAIMDNLKSYMEYDVYDSVFSDLRDGYLCRWEMNKPNVWRKLSCINRGYYRNLLNGDKRNDIEEIMMYARVEFVRELSEKGCSIWGVGFMGRILLKALAAASIKVQHVFDSDAGKFGKSVEGFLVEDFENTFADNIIVTTSKFYKEIKERIGDKAANVYDLDKQIGLIPEETGDDQM